MLEVRLGAALGFFKIRDVSGFEDFFTAMRPATFRVSNDLQTFSEKKCDEIRAETVGTALPELIAITRRK
jgi:protein-arginine kinase